MNTKTLLVYLILSLLVFAFVIIPKGDTKYFNHLKSQIELSNQIITKTNQAILSAIQTQVEAYPEYKIFEENALIIDSTTTALREIQTNLNDEVNKHFLSLISNDYFHYYNIKEEKVALENSLLNYNLLANQEDLKPLNFTLNQSALEINKMIFLNFFAEKSRGTSFCCFCGPEIVSIYNQSVFRLEEKNTLQFVLAKISNRTEYKTTKISVNGNELMLREQKAKFKVKAKKSGWNEMNILVNATFKGKAVQKEKTFRYYVK